MIVYFFCLNNPELRFWHFENAIPKTIPKTRLSENIEHHQTATFPNWKIGKKLGLNLYQGHLQTWMT